MNYQGVIIEESLENKAVLDKVKIIKTKISPVVEKHRTPWVKQWTMHTVEIPEQDAEKVAEQLSKDLDKKHSWYADFKNENYHFIIYKGKIFKVDLKNSTLYKNAKQYGVTLGIPEYQLDFSPQMKSEDVVSIYTKLENLGVKIWVDGGWSVDALLGEQTRDHQDLDIAVNKKDVESLLKFLEGEGYKEIRKDRECNPVFGDNFGREIDIHAFITDEKGNIVDGIMYPTQSLTGSGIISGYPVRCISSKYMVEFLAPWIYKWPEKYLDAVSKLCKKFSIELPKEYTNYKNENINLIETLQSLEPVFIQAAQLALKMQAGAKHHNKFNTGNELADIVTEADLAVQEFLLDVISKTDLVNCRLLAEEDTPSTEKFNKQGKYYLCIDPIDGTATYAKGGKYFSTIVSLHDGKKILYVFVYFPVFNYTHKVINNNYSTTGKMPEFILPAEAKNTIVYWSGNPEKNIAKEIYEKLISQGMIFTKVTDFSPDVDATTMFAYEKVAGVYHERLNVYDSLVDFSIASAKGLKIYPDGFGNMIDLTNIEKREYGLSYSGYYLALNNI